MNLRYIVVFVTMLLVLFSSCQDIKKVELRVMSFNMWHGGDAGKQPLCKSVETILKSEADIVGAQETHGKAKPRPDNSKIMADSLKWNHIDLGHYDAVMTDLKICERDKNCRAVKIEVADGKYIWFINTHLKYIPYQPYQINDKKYGDYPFISTEEEAINWANKARKHQVDALVKLVQEKQKDGLPIILTGDFNEPSHLDWTEKAAKAGLCKTKVAWPSTKALTDIGMTDVYREIYPDEVKYPGHTWSSIDTKGEIHDRIDFIFYWGDKIKVSDAKIVGEKTGKADIIIKNYPSDHRAVVATFELE